MADKIPLETMPTGVPGLDTLLAGGIPRYAFVVIAGAPGSGKTTLAHQIMFSLTSGQRKALFFTIMGEPPLKMLRYQQQYTFFDSSRIGTSIRYVNLADDLQRHGFEGVLDRIQQEIEAFQPEFVFVDSFKSAIQATRGQPQSTAGLQYFVQRLGLHLSTWQATTFLIGEYPEPTQADNPIFTVADGIIHLSQDSDENAVVRKVRVVKMRGMPHMSGLHSLRMSTDGLRVFPRLLKGGILDTLPRPQSIVPPPDLSTGCASLDQMLGGGIPPGYSLLVAGPPGAGKTMLGTSFLQAGAAAGEHGIVTSFEHGVSSAPNRVVQQLIDAGRISVVRPASLDFSIEELVTNLADAADRTGARRILIDSLSALELLLSPQFRLNFEEALFRMLANLHARGICVMMIHNQTDLSSQALSPGSFIVDGIILMRYREEDHHLIRLISVTKLRGRPHSSDVRSYRTTERGIEIDGPA